MSTYVPSNTCVLTLLLGRCPVVVTGCPARLEAHHSRPAFPKLPQGLAVQMLVVVQGWGMKGQY